MSLFIQDLCTRLQCVGTTDYVLIPVKTTMVPLDIGCVLSALRYSCYVLVDLGVWKLLEVTDTLSLKVLLCNLQIKVLHDGIPAVVLHCDDFLEKGTSRRFHFSPWQDFKFLPGSSSALAKHARPSDLLL